LPQNPKTPKPQNPIYYIQIFEATLWYNYVYFI
jgi:hypothetical protein